MRLHQDKNAFQAIIDRIVGNDDPKIKAILEKDYYVTLLLYELTNNPKRQNVYFKGGTALYKALKTIGRFSEDIDLSIDVSTLNSGNKCKRFVKDVALGFKSLPIEKPLENDIKGNIVSGRYHYDPIYKLSNDSLNRIGQVRVEVNSFSIIVPNNELTIAPHLYELSNKETKKILEDRYGIKPFKIKTMTIERIFVDKIFAIEYYYLKKKYLDVAKHVYDVAVLYNHPQIRDLLRNKKELDRLIKYKKEEEISNKSSVINQKTNIKELKYFNGIKNNKEFEKSYAQMNIDYVIKEKDRIDNPIDIITNLNKLL